MKSKKNVVILVLLLIIILLLFINTKDNFLNTNSDIRNINNIDIENLSSYIIEGENTPMNYYYIYNLFNTIVNLLTDLKNNYIKKKNNIPKQYKISQSLKKYNYKIFYSSDDFKQHLNDNILKYYRILDLIKTSIESDYNNIINSNAQNSTTFINQQRKDQIINNTDGQTNNIYFNLLPNILDFINNDINIFNSAITQFNTNTIEDPLDHKKLSNLYDFDFSIKRVNYNNLEKYY